MLVHLHWQHVVGHAGKLQVELVDARQKNDLAAENLKSLRSQNELSRDRVITLLKERGVSLHVNSLRRIEEGLQPLKLQEAIAFSDIYGITIDELINSPLVWPESVFAFEIRNAESMLKDLANSVWKFAYSLQSGKATLLNFADEYAGSEHYQKLSARIGPWQAGLIEMAKTLEVMGVEHSLLDEALSELKELGDGPR